MKAWYLGVLAALFSLVMMFVSDGWQLFWFGVLFVGACAETIALYRGKTEDTFSFSVWVKTRTPWQKVFLAIFMIWLTLHLIFQGPFS